MDELASEDQEERASHEGRQELEEVECELKIAESRQGIRNLEEAVKEKEKLAKQKQDETDIVTAENKEENNL
ncbi:hypothetical protein H2201_004926 [Coniosporium apollinis]|uniref:Uncharacterized protein n=1 Tax=Coniosporium apollinis TaxID=61459 RepID=A0ABQ9NRN4_9PEZI|nr:hypothetical protein H2201_004926 [Coniosporium apollinis]